jgi:putative transposase
LIDAKRAEVPVETACAVLNVSVSGFYSWKRRPASLRQTRDMVLLAHIRAEFSTSNGTYGSRHAEGVLRHDACMPSWKTVAWRWDAIGSLG